MILYLGEEKVPCLERCPQFMGVLIEGFHPMSQCMIPTYTHQSGSLTWLATTGIVAVL